MFSGKTETANLSLAHLGIGLTITDLDTDNTVEAKTCRMFYDIATNHTLSRFRWGFAKVVEALTLVEERPNRDWFYAYAYPSTCLYGHKILGAERNPSRWQEIPWQVFKGTSQSLIMTDQPEASLEFTKKSTDLDFLPADFILANSYFLASLIAAKLAKGNYTKLVQSIRLAYDMEIREAATRNANEQKRDVRPESDLIIGR